MRKKIIKSAAFQIVFLGLLSLASGLAFAQDRCYKNGVEISCEELDKSIRSFFAWGIGVLLFVFALAVLATVFWIIMIVHAARHTIKNKAVWIIVIVFTWVLGAIIYYFAVKRSLDKQSSQQVTITTQQ